VKTTAQERMALGTVVLLFAAGAGARVLRPAPAPAEWSGPGVEAEGSAPTALRQRVETEVAREQRRNEPLGPEERLDPNTAPADELVRLPGVGPALAERIVAYRAAHGPFRTLADLDSVSGVGPALLARAAPHLALAPAPPRRPALLSAAAAASPARSPAGPVDVNHATPAELETLPGVGPALAARIVQARPFRSVDELAKVPGIGPRTLERLRPAVRASP
jgi:competence protein ComEA